MISPFHAKIPRFSDRLFVLQKATAPNGKPDISIELSGTTIESVAKGMTSRKNVLQASRSSSLYYKLARY